MSVKKYWLIWYVSQQILVNLMSAEKYLVIIMSAKKTIKLVSGEKYYLIWCQPNNIG